jgi:hypothetical protein
MRVMMRVFIPVEAGNAAIKDGSLPNTFQKFMDLAQPEAAYFVADGGERTAYFFFDLKEPSAIPSIAEPFFMNLQAAIDITPAMNLGDVQKGLEAALKSD